METLSSTTHSGHATSDTLTIAAIESHVFRLPMRGALQWGKHSALTEAVHVAVRVVLSDGSEGWAEAPPRPTIYGETIHSITSAIRAELSPRIVGLSVWEETDAEVSLWANPRLQHIHARLHELKNNHTAKASIDMALHEALGQHRGMSLLDHLLDGQDPATAHRQVAASYILGIGALETVLDEAESIATQGVRVLKVKVGRDWEDDVTRIRLLQERLGPSVRLYADANECLTRDDAPHKLDTLANLGLLYCEEPLPVELINARRMLRAGNHLPLIADDSAFTLRDLQRELAFDTFDILNIKTARTGFTESAAMLALARQHGKGVMVGSQASTGLGTRHAAIFAALPGIDHPSELSFPLKLHSDLLDFPLRFQDGWLDVADVQAARLDRSKLTTAAAS